MGKVVKAELTPKVFAFKSERVLPVPQWDERRFMDWVHHTCKGTVWYQATLFQPYGYPPRNNVCPTDHHILKVWFSKKADAMLFKLTYE